MGHCVGTNPGRLAPKPSACLWLTQVRGQGAPSWPAPLPGPGLPPQGSQLHASVTCDVQTRWKGTRMSDQPLPAAGASKRLLHEGQREGGRQIGGSLLVAGVQLAVPLCTSRRPGNWPARPERGHGHEGRAPGTRSRLWAPGHLITETQMFIKRNWKPPSGSNLGLWVLLGPPKH